MGRQLMVAGLVPPLVLVLGFFAAAVVTYQRVPRELQFAVPVVRFLAELGLRSESVGRWSHQPINDGSNAATIRTHQGYVQVIVFNPETDLAHIRITETVAAEPARYTYRVAGLPGRVQPAWDSSYRWFLTVRGNWLLVTTDATITQKLRTAVLH